MTLTYVGRMSQRIISMPSLIKAVGSTVAAPLGYHFLEICVSSSTQLGSPLCIAGYSPPQDHGENDDHQTEAANSDGGNDREVVVVDEAFALRCLDVFTIGLQIDLKMEIAVI